MPEVVELRGFDCAVAGIEHEGRPAKMIVFICPATAKQYRVVIPNQEAIDALIAQLSTGVVIATEMPT
jgi:hypothetical protein